MSALAPMIYVVDDDRFVRCSLEQLLRVAGYLVQSFESSLEFLNAFPLTERGCVILDLKMPALDGLAVQQSLRAMTSDLPVIFLSAHGDVPSSVQAMKSGAADFLVKPIAPSRLLDVIRQALDNASQVGRTSATDCGAGLGHPDRPIRNVSQEYEDQQLLERERELSTREREVLALVVTGWLNKQIAGELGIALQTVKSHRARVMQKLNTKSLTELVRLADRLEQLGVMKLPRKPAAGA
ncbi:MAG: response regulator transcription factor [Planctomycetota bacterium]